MNDYLTTFEQYKDIKGITDLIDEVNKLREYYNTQQYAAMNKHINSLTTKYLVETFLWNSTHPTMPATVQQSFIIAEVFLRLKGISVLMKNGIKVQEQLTAEEIQFIESTIR